MDPSDDLTDTVAKFIAIAKTTWRVKNFATKFCRGDFKPKRLILIVAYQLGI